MSNNRGRSKDIYDKSLRLQEAVFQNTTESIREALEIITSREPIIPFLKPYRSKNYTLPQLAALHCNLELFKALVAHPNFSKSEELQSSSEWEWNIPSLMEALFKKHNCNDKTWEFAQYLVDHYQSNEQDQYGFELAICNAAQFNKTELVKKLLRGKEGNWDQINKASSSDGLSALHYAIKNDNFEMFNLLLKNGYSPFIRYRANEKAQTALDYIEKTHIPALQAEGRKILEAHEKRDIREIEIHKELNKRKGRKIGDIIVDIDLDEKKSSDAIKKIEENYAHVPDNIDRELNKLRELSDNIKRWETICHEIRMLKELTSDLDEYIGYVGSLDLRKAHVGRADSLLKDLKQGIAPRDILQMLERANKAFDENQTNDLLPQQAELKKYEKPLVNKFNDGYNQIVKKHLAKYRQYNNNQPVQGITSAPSPSISVSMQLKIRFYRWFTFWNRPQASNSQEQIADQRQGRQKKVKTSI